MGIQPVKPALEQLFRATVKVADPKYVSNTPLGKSSKEDDSSIRKAAIGYRIPYVTTIAAALSAVQGIAAFKQEASKVKSLQRYHEDISRV